VVHFCVQRALSLVTIARGFGFEFNYLAALLTDPEDGTVDALQPDVALFPSLAHKASKDPDLPSYDQAMSGDNRAEYREAMAKEISDLEHHGTWRTIKRSEVPKDAKILPSTWVLRLKRYPDGRPRKYKARFCVRGDRQVEGEDYDEKYSPVISWPNVRLMLSLSVSQNWYTRQVDFSNAFVQARLRDDEHIYVHPPRGFVQGTGIDAVVLKLQRSLYGLVQAPLYWGNHLRTELEKVGFSQSKCDPCIYYAAGVIAVTYVDDVLFFGKDPNLIDSKIKAIEKNGLELTIEDDIYAFLGVEVTRKPGGEIEMTQKGLIEKILKTCDMMECNPKKTPCNTIPLGSDLEGADTTGRIDYASVVGMLMYLSSNTRPDIQMAVHQCARFTHFPKKSHKEAIMRICRYLKGTKTRGLIFKPEDEMNAEDHQDPVCVRSRTGYCLTLDSCPVLWVSKLQTEIALSTVEAEYIALSQSMRDLLPMR
jgi:Reverse transcriptase (RNA-dependent DNA polymerase)